MERLTQIFQNQEPSQQIQSCLTVLSEVHESRQEAHDDWLLSLSLAWDHVEELWNTDQIDLALYNRWQSTIYEHYDTVEQDLADAQSLISRNRASDQKVLRHWGVLPTAVLEQEFYGEKPLGKNLRGVLAEIASSGCPLIQAQQMIRDAVEARVAHPRQGVSSTRKMSLSDVRAVRDKLPVSESSTSKKRKRARKADTSFRPASAYNTRSQTLREENDFEDRSIELARHRLGSLSNGVDDPFNSELSVSSRATPPRITLSPRITPTPRTTPSPAHIPIDHDELLASPATFADVSPQGSSTLNHPSLVNAGKRMQDAYAIFCSSHATWQTMFTTYQEHLQASLSTTTAGYESATQLHLDSRSTMLDAEKDVSKSLIILQAARSDRDVAAATVESHSGIYRHKDRATDSAILLLLDKIDARIDEMNNRLLNCEAVVGWEEKRVAAALIKVETCRSEEARLRQEVQRAEEGVEAAEEELLKLSQHKSTVEASVGLRDGGGWRDGPVM
ncbi:MAG: hypothetical protein Q9173_006859 [Seirophora scorigena]